MYFLVNFIAFCQLTVVVLLPLLNFSFTFDWQL